MQRAGFCLLVNEPELQKRAHSPSALGPPKADRELQSSLKSYLETSVINSQHWAGSFKAERERKHLGPKREPESFKVSKAGRGA